MLHSSIIKSKSKVSNYGLFAQRPIQQDEIVWRHSSTAIKFDPRELDKLPNSTYRIGDFYYIDVDSEDAKFMNHSCDPNCWYEGDDKIVARQFIAAGEEVTYDYSFVEIPIAIKHWVSPWACQCGAQECRGRIGSKDLLEPILLERYKFQIPSWTREWIEEYRELKLRTLAQ